ncbi:hypothetical protein HYU45_00520 [Candidatus Daviesbacteria bacterium]|nr:hypothetical protein [Candidatus Daviesbacteria bacterium]
MITQQSQIKINLPLALKDFLESRAQRFGLPLATYVRHLIVRDVENMEYPEFEASDATIKAYKRALKNKDKAVTFNNIEELDKYLKNL